MLEGCLSSVDWRHFGTERRPHTCSREGCVWMEWYKGELNLNSESRNDIAIQKERTTRADKHGGKGQPPHQLMLMFKRRGGNTKRKVK